MKQTGKELRQCRSRVFFLARNSDQYDNIKFSATDTIWDKLFCCQPTICEYLREQFYYNLKSTSSPCKICFFFQRLKNSFGFSLGSKWGKKGIVIERNYSFKTGWK